MTNMSRRIFVEHSGIKFEKTLQFIEAALFASQWARKLKKSRPKKTHEIK